MRKKYLIAGVVLALSLSMVGCGKDTGSTTAEDTTGDVTTEAEVASDTDTEEVTEEEVEEVSTWFSENGISFAGSGVSIPVYAYARNEDGSEDDSVEMTQEDATYSEPFVDVSEPDADGNITYTVTYNVSGTWIGTMAADSDGYYMSYVKFDGYSFVDAYTGTVFPGAGMTDDENSYAADSVVEVDGKEYKISTSQSFESNFEDPSWSFIDNNTKAKATVDYSIDVTKVAVVPAEYDGLILALDGTGMTENKDIDTEIKEAHPFDGNVSDYIFKDVAYGSKQYWNEGKACLVYQLDGEDMYVNVRVSEIQISFSEYKELSDDEKKEIEKDGYVKITWVDGTETPISGEVSYSTSANGDGISIYYAGTIDYTKIQSITVGNVEYSDGIFSKDNF